MEQWRDSGYLELLDNYGGKFEHCLYFGFEGYGRFEGWSLKEDGA